MDRIGMQVKDTPPKLLTDLEVHQFLKEIKSSQQRKTPTPLATITYETLRYLDDRPSATQTPELIRKAQERFSLLPFELPNDILLQLLNNPPETILDIQVILGDFIHSVNDEDIDAILTASKEVFGDANTY